MKVYSVYGTGFSLAYAAPWLLVISNILFTVSIGLFLLDYFDKFTFKFLWFFLAAAAALIFLLFFIDWLSLGVAISVGGVFFLIFQAGLTAVTVLLLLEKLKKR